MPWFDAFSSVKTNVYISSGCRLCGLYGTCRTHLLLHWCFYGVALRASVSLTMTVGFMFFRHLWASFLVQLWCPLPFALLGQKQISGGVLEALSLDLLLVSLLGSSRPVHWTTESSMWLYVCLSLPLLYFLIITQTSGGDYEMLAGNLASIGVGGIISVATSLIVRLLTHSVLGSWFNFIVARKFWL